MPGPIRQIDTRMTGSAVVVLDGGLATELEARGSDLNHHLWSAKELTEHPLRIRDIHLSFLHAGADCITTVSYQASVKGLVEDGYSVSEARELISKSVRLAEEARTIFLKDGTHNGNPMIAGSIGPYGAYLSDGSEYRGQYTVSKQELSDFHRDRLHILADSNIDLLAIETIPSFAEAQVLLELLQSRPTTRAWFSFSCRDDTHISDGTPLIECAHMLSESEQVLAIGVNCVAPSLIPSLIREVQTGAPDKTVIVYPNSGEDYDAVRKCWTGTADPIEFGQAAIEWYQAGARIIGGCCRTTPLHISEMKSALSEA